MFTYYKAKFQGKERYYRLRQEEAEGVLRFKFDESTNGQQWKSYVHNHDVNHMGSYEFNNSLDSQIFLSYDKRSIRIKPPKALLSSHIPLNEIEKRHLPTSLQPKTQTIQPLRSPLKRKFDESPSRGYLSMQLLGIFGAVIGIAAVAIALIVLSGTGLAVATGLGATLATIGFLAFAYGRYKTNESSELEETQYSPKRLNFNV
jgi:hypothetical protein